MFDKLLSKRGLSFDRLRALLDLAEAGSLSKAAQRGGGAAGVPIRRFDLHV